MSILLNSVKKQLEKSGYRFIGKHSAVKICEWTKKSLAKNKVCYKEKWYPEVKSHRCCQCTTSLFCFNNCIYCWRHFAAKKIKFSSFDEPSEIIDEMIQFQRQLLSGFKGNEKIDKKKWEESQNPMNFALSLVGESLLYSRISDFIRELNKRKASTFLVTKGTLPEQLRNLEVEPTNLYISLCAPDKKTFIKVDKPTIQNAWKKQTESLELMKSFSCRTVIRITLVKKFNLISPDKYAELILKAEPDFVEVKGYSWLGESRNKLSESAVPTMEDVKKFAEKISEFTGYEIKDYDEPSRVVLLANS